MTKKLKKTQQPSSSSQPAKTKPCPKPPLTPQKNFISLFVTPLNPKPLSLKLVHSSWKSVCQPRKGKKVKIKLGKLCPTRG